MRRSGTGFYMGYFRFWPKADIGDERIGVAVAEPTHVVSFASEAHFTNVTPGGDQVPSSTSPLGQ